MLERADGVGLPLTAAGYLKPEDVKALAEVMPAMDHWPFSTRREIDTRPVLNFREYLKEIGLLRKYKGTLRLTKAGREGLTDAGALWRHIAEHLVPAGEEFDAYTAVVILVHSSTTEGEVDIGAVARTMTALGWIHEDDQPIEERDVYPLWNALWDALGNVGERVAVGARGSSRELGDAARILVHDALFEEIEGELPR